VPLLRADEPIFDVYWDAPELSAELRDLPRLRRGSAKQKQWKVFSSRMSKGSTAVPLDDLLAVISLFFWPLLEALHANTPFERVWKAPGPWRRLPASSPLPL
jgi:hypothetical protein